MILLKKIFFSVAKLATEQIGPLVRKMDDAGRIDPSVVDMLFENGVNNITN